MHDAITKESIEDVNVDLGNGNFLLTEESGKFAINDENITEVVLSHLGYKKVKVSINSQQILYMEPETFVMEELVLAKRDIKAKKVFPKVNISNLLPHSYGTGAPLHKNELKATFIPNEDKREDYFISKIILEPTGYTTMDLKKSEKEKYKDARYLPFLVNLYTADTVIGIPLAPVFEQSIIAKLKKGAKYVVIELDSKIAFPKEGIFIVVSAMNDENNASKGSSPAFNSVGVHKNSLFKQYIYNNNEGFWKRDKWFWDHNSVYYFGLELE